MEETEVWKESEYTGYYFSSFGRAGRLLKNGNMRILVGCSCGAGYRAISIPVAYGSYRRVYIHRGVCTAFDGPCPDGMECRHLDGDKLNNRPENLKWGTPYENSQDKIGHGTVAKGEKNSIAKLTYAKVEEMRLERKEMGTTFKRLAEKHGVTTMTAYRATTEQSWT